MTESLTARIRSIARSRPAATACLTATGPLGFRALMSRADAVVTTLNHASVPPGARVGLLVPHGDATVIASLGVLLHGSTYVVLDASWPPAHRAALIRDHRIEALLTGADGTPGTDPDVALHTTARVLRHDPATPGDPDRIHPDESSPVPAYLSFTSGTTGRPKTVHQSRAALVHLADNQCRSLALRPGDHLSLLTTFAYDMAVVDQWSALLNGCTVVPYDLARDGLPDLAEHLARHRVSILHAAPTILRALLTRMEAAPTPGSWRPRLVLSGGETLLPDDVHRLRRAFPGVRVVNGYGCSEASFVAHHHIGPGDPIGERVPIGRALPGFEVQLVPTSDGLGTELVVRGRHVVAGYLTGAGPTSDTVDAAFTRHPDGTTSFRTGDVVEQDSSGQVHVLGRADHQVNIGGHRVHPLQSESVLGTHPDLTRAAVVAVTAPGGDPTSVHLAALCRRRPGGCVDERALRRWLGDRLPRPLVPSLILLVDDVPLTASGKIDRVAAADVARAHARRLGTSTGVPTGAATCPVDVDPDVHARVAAAYARALGADEALPGDVPFFDLGGSSLELAEVLDALTPQHALAFTTLLTHPTIDGLARHLSTTHSAPHPGEPSSAAAGARAARRRAALTGRAARSRTRIGQA